MNNIREWADRNSVTEMYAELVMDSMDMKTMEQFVFDTLYQQYSCLSDQELISEIADCYGMDFFAENDIELPPECDT